jgi:hypothetical protein
MNFLQEGTPQSIFSYTLADTVRIEVSCLSIRTQTRNQSHDIMSGIALWTSLRHCPANCPCQDQTIDDQDAFRLHLGTKVRRLDFWRTVTIDVNTHGTEG